MTSENVNSVDWDRIAYRHQEALRLMVHGTPEQRYVGPDFYAEALRRAFGYEPANTGQFGRESLLYGFGLLTAADAKHTFDTSGLDRMHREQADEQVKQMRAEVQRVYREAANDLADFLRAKCNERSVPSRYRREGVAWAADMIDPRVPKTPYGNLREASAGAA